MMQGLAPSFVSKPKIEQTAKIATIQFDIVADPSPSLHWTKDGKELLNVDKILTRFTPNGANRYTVSLDIKVSSFFKDERKHHQSFQILRRMSPRLIVAFTNVLCRMNWVQPLQTSLLKLQVENLR